MLRRSKNTSTNSNVDMKKRQSMFLGSKSSATSLSSEFVNGHSKTKQKKQESSSSLFSSVTHKNRSNLKRSSMLLDETVLKDYHSAIKHMQMDNAKEEKLRFAQSPTQSTRSESDASLSSSKSAMSSIFSLENDYSIHDLLYEEIEEMDKEADGAKVNNTIAMDESKALFIFCSNESSLRMASNETLHDLIWDTPDAGSDRRTSLNFF